MATRNYESLDKVSLQPAEDNNEIGNILPLQLVCDLCEKYQKELALSKASLYTNKAAEVEKWFADINPFDEMAEATTGNNIAGINQGVADVAKTAGIGLAKGAIGDAYAQLDKQVESVYDKVKDAIQSKLQKIKGPSLTGRGKVATYGSGALGGGVAEAIFTDDIEEVGTFGDLIGGPTELDRGLEGTEYDPGQHLINRLKFGLEGV